jgi:hypothetical protein
MCCNLAGECESKALPKLLQVDKYGFHSYAEFTLVFLLSFTGFVCLVVILLSLHDGVKKIIHSRSFNWMKGTPWNTSGLTPFIHSS